MKPKKNPNQLKIKKVGTLSVPFSQGQFSQLLMWLKRLQGDVSRLKDMDKECPIDLSVLPDSPPDPTSMKDKEIFYVFREMSVVDDYDENQNEIVFCYDRMRVESGGIEKAEILHHGDLDGDELVREVASHIKDEHGIVLSQELLKRLQRENPSLRGVKDADTFLTILQDRGLFRKSSSSYVSHLKENTTSTSVPINKKDETNT